MGPGAFTERTSETKPQTSKPVCRAGVLQRERFDKAVGRPEWIFEVPPSAEHPDASTVNVGERDSPHSVFQSQAARLNLASHKSEGSVSYVDCIRTKFDTTGCSKRAVDEKEHCQQEDARPSSSEKGTNYCALEPCNERLLNLVKTGFPIPMCHGVYEMPGVPTPIDDNLRPFDDAQTQ